MLSGLLVSYWSDDQWRLGAASGDRVVALDVDNLPGSSAMHTLLVRGEEAWSATVAQAERRLRDGSHLLPRESLLLGPTIPDPGKILCVGFNYSEHTDEMEVERPTAANVFAKFGNSLVGDGSPVPLPRRSAQIDYEGELAAVIGRRCRNARSDTALDHVAGYTIVNDVTARDLQFRTSQWTLGKAFDAFCPMGPGLAPRDQIADVQGLKIVTKVNGRTVQDGSTRDMVFSVAELIVEISSVMTLEPGDVISTGTPAGVGYKSKPPRFLEDGDVVEISIEPIGTLRSVFTAALDAKSDGVLQGNARTA